MITSLILMLLGICVLFLLYKVYTLEYEVKLYKLKYCKMENEKIYDRSYEWEKEIYCVEILKQIKRG